MSRSDLEEYILQQGLDDWVPLLAIDGQARLLLDENDPAVRAGAVATAVSNLVRDRLVEVGTVTKDEGFVALPAPAPQDDVRRAYSTYEPVHWGFELWISNTDAGDASTEA